MIAYSGIKPGSDESSKDDRGIVTSSLIFRFTATDQGDTSYDVGSHAFCPRIGTPHPEDFSNWCVGLNITNPDPFAGWEVAASYSTEREITEDPLDEPAVIGPWDSDSYQEVAEIDNDDNVIANSAGDPYDPPLMKDFSRRNVTVRKNVASVPTWFLDYEDAVNSDEFTVGGLTVDIGKAKCKKTQISEAKVRNGTTYYEVTTVLQFSKKGWTRRVADMGFREIAPDGISRKKITMTNEDGELEYPAAPVALDGSGSYVANPTLANRVYNEHDIEDRLPFSVLPLS